MAGSRLLFVGDDNSLPDGLTVGDCAGALSALDPSVGTVTDPGDALAALDASVACVVCGLSLDEAGLEVLRGVRDRTETVPIVQLAGPTTDRVPLEALALDGISYCRLDATADPTADLAETVAEALADDEAERAAGETDGSESGVTGLGDLSSGAAGHDCAYRELVQHVPDPVYMLDEEGYVTMVNEALLREGGYDRESFLGSHITEIIPMDDFEHGVELILELMQSSRKQSETFELEIEHADGTTREYEDHLTVVTDEDGEFVGSVGIIRDIQERKERERELRRERNRSEALFEAVPEPLVHVRFEDGEPLVQTINDAFEDVFGYDAEDLVGKNLNEYIIPGDQRSGTLEVDERARERTEIEREVTRVTADGEREFLFRSVPLPERDDDEPVESIGVYVDITERKERERELEQYETVVEAVDDLVYAVDDEGRFQFVNEAQESMTGYSPDELLGEHMSVLMGEESRAKARERIDELRESDQQGVTFERTATTADGETIVCEDNMSLLPSPDGEFRGTAGIIRDITARKERERELEQYETLVEAVPDTMWATDEDGYFTFVNDAGAERFDYTSDDIETGEVHFSESIADEDVEKFVEAHRRLLSEEYDTGGKAVIEYTAVTQDGRRFPAETHFSLLDTDDEEGSPGAGITRDVTERKQRQERLQVLNRVLRHNLRNDLTAVISGSDVVAERMRAICNDEEGASIAETTSEVGREVVEMSEEIRQIGKALERESIESPRIDAVETIEHVVAEYRERHPEASIETDLPDEAAVEADHSLELVVEQLIENAIEHNDSERPWVQLTIEERDRDRGDWYELRVADDGPGIPEHERVVIDEDTEVTPLQHGSGIGLWAVAWIANSFDGSVDFAADGSGSIVTVTLRRAVQATTEQ